MDRMEMNDACDELMAPRRPLAPASAMAQYEAWLAEQEEDDDQPDPG
jgi:hypothetical protein